VVDEYVAFLKKIRRRALEIERHFCTLALTDTSSSKLTIVTTNSKAGFFVFGEAGVVIPTQKIMLPSGIDSAA
jgi:hypothetical protein